MVLILTLANASLLSDQTDNTRMLDGGTLTIGRSGESDWVLPDPTRHLSKRHCVIAVENGKYVLEDTSANGTIVGDGDEPLGQGNSIALRDGDRLRLGAYRIDVTILEAAPSTAEGDAASPAVQKNPPPLDLFSEAESGRAPPPSSSPLPERPTIPLEAEPLIPDDDDFLSPLPAEPTFESENIPSLGTTPDDHAPAQSAFFALPKVTAAPIPENWDPFAEPDDLRPSPTPATSSGQAAPSFSPQQRADLAEFLAGAGLDTAAVPPELEAKILRAAGAALREAVEGLRTILAARGELRSTFQIEHTMLRAQDNNPIKFSETTQEALRAMLLVPGTAFMPSDKAMRQGMQDVQAHQMAVIAGMQEAIAVLLRRFDPQSLQRRMDGGASLAALLPGARKGKYWDVFCEIYQEVAAEIEGELPGLFRKAFARAYEEQAKSRR